MKPGPKPFANKICPACGENKPRSEFYKKGSSVSHKCKPCSLKDIRSRSHAYIGKYSDYVNNWKRNKYANEQSYREKIASQKKSCYEKNKTKINERRRIRWATDPNNPARKYHRRKDVKGRTPKWVDLNEILKIYAECPIGYVVDHIVPLKGIIDGNRVTGLHVPWNLQYLTKEQNLKKGNRITEQTLRV